MARPTKSCPKCRTVQRLTVHHCLPKRWYGRKNNSKYLLYLCRGCHDILEDIIHARERTHGQLDTLEYLHLAIKFLEDV